FSNILSTRAAREVTQVRSDPEMQVSGLSGKVSEVYRADQAALQFGRYEQKNQDIVTFDLSAVCKQTGTEVSGILGYAMLRIFRSRSTTAMGWWTLSTTRNICPSRFASSRAQRTGVTAVGPTFISFHGFGLGIGGGTNMAIWTSATVLWVSRIM